MKNLYTPVRRQTFVNPDRRTFYTVKVAIHNRPTVTLMWGRVEGGARFQRQHVLASRSEARELAETRIDKLVSTGYAQVA